MDLQTSALLIIGSLALITFAYFGAKVLLKTTGDSGNFSATTQSCYRIKSTSDTFVYKAGFLLFSNKKIENVDIRKVTAILGTTSGDGKFDVTSKSISIPPFKMYYLNAVCTIKKTLSAPELPGYTSPGSDLTFSIRIDLADGTHEQIDEIKIIPIDLDPC